MSAGFSVDDVVSQFDRFQKKAVARYREGKFDSALYYANKAARLMYAYNCVYKDEALEQVIRGIGDSVRLDAWNKNVKRITLVDSFSLSARGLAWIYCKAILDAGFELQYIGFDENIDSKNFVPLHDYLMKHDAHIVGISLKESMLRQALNIAKVISDFGPDRVFFHGTPWDVASLVAIAALPDGVMRYLIDLTDHAFWLGAEVFDYYLEFREYGRYIGLSERGIPDEKLQRLPYYPAQLLSRVEYRGLPFDEEQLFFLSGGSAYKTEGCDIFPGMVGKILEKHPCLNFLFLSDKEPSWFEELQAKFPNRVYLEAERDDLFLVMRKAIFYLSTFPISGGLMAQIAAVAGKIPVTLASEGMESISSLFLNRDIKIEYTTESELLEEVDRLVDDSAYRIERAMLVRQAVMSPEGFAMQFDLVLSGNAHFVGDSSVFDLESFTKIYMEQNPTYNDMACLMFDKRDLRHSIAFDKLTRVGICEKLRQKIGGFRQRISRWLLRF